MRAQHRMTTRWIVAIVMSLLVMCAGAPQPVAAQQVSLSGWLHIIWGDRPPGSDADAAQIFGLIDDQGHWTSIILDEAFTRPLGGPLALNRKRVTILAEPTSAFPDGIQAQSRQAVQARSIVLEQAEGAEGVWREGASSSSSAVSGSQPWISILCKFADVASTPRPLSYFQDMFGSTYPGLDHYWHEQSYDLVNIVGSGAKGWYTLPQPRSYYVSSTGADLGRLADDCTAAADADVYFPDYAGINLMFNDNLDGYAWGGSWTLNVDGVFKGYRLTWEPPWGYENITVMGHEMGHGFGLPHSSGNYGQVYDNPWDVMSDGWTYCSLSTDSVYGCLGQHTIAYHKDMLAWIPAGQKYTAAPNSSDTIVLERLALPQTTNYKMAQIPIGGSTTHFYTVEVRDTVGYDVKLPGPAVIIHEVDTTRLEPAHVLDTDHNGNSGDAGTMWLPGETFTDSANQISIAVDAATASGFQVTITTTVVTPGTLAITTTPVGGDIFVDGMYKGAGSWTDTIAPGSHTVTFGAMAGYTTPASQTVTVTANQTTSVTGTYTLARPDLTGTWGSLSQSCRTKLGVLTCTLRGQVTVSNQGNAPASAASVLNVFLSSDGTTQETLLAQVAVDTLAVGRTRRARLRVPLPVGTTASGKYVIAVVDATNTLTELNETNNVSVFGPLP